MKVWLLLHRLPLAPVLLHRGAFTLATISGTYFNASNACIGDAMVTPALLVDRAGIWSEREGFREFALDVRFQQHPSTVQPVDQSVSHDERTVRRGEGMPVEGRSTEEGDLAQRETLEGKAEEFAGCSVEARYDTTSGEMKTGLTCETPLGFRSR